MPSWRVALVAVADGFHRRGIATAMKTSVLRTAQVMGATDVVFYNVSGSERFWFVMRIPMPSFNLASEPLVGSQVLGPGVLVVRSA
jgi:hypothetical protein